eukprot:CAMPEP_0204111864 /NCGR_PEP_ID=MMETSP0361-20130328/2720_1 /ASSEMBLY_ACC=CAM_ASM_000343 /TAXON_ID=268821 /ORGANISM="Scrippsiella Hangoei, Strain SHTV-5" /LENGTH=31 /DNA_ID= /DNA_START= /DNA_END= /DNA_ORIENTATION=
MARQPSSQKKKLRETPSHSLHDIGILTLTSG